MEFLGDYPSTDEEKVRYDTASFPLYIVQGNLIIFRGMAVHCHWHEDFEFIFVLNGHMEYNVNGTTVSLVEGEGIFVNSRQLHYGYSADGTDCDYICVLLSHSLLNVSRFVTEHFLLPVSENVSMPYLHLLPAVLWQRDLLEQIRLVYSVYQESAPGFQLEIQAIFLRMLNILYRNMPLTVPVTAAQERTDTERMKLMITCVESHITDQITLDEIAASAGVSAGTCTRLFRHYLHRTPIEHLIELRLEHAANLLQESHLTVTEIAYRSGFSDSSYFTRRFRSRYGVTPREYRKDRG